MLSFSLKAFCKLAVSLIMLVILTHSYKTLQDKRSIFYSFLEEEDYRTCSKNSINVERSVMVSVLNKHVSKPSLENLALSKSYYKGIMSPSFKMNYSLQEYHFRSEIYQYFNECKFCNYQVLPFEFQNLSNLPDTPYAFFKISSLLKSYLFRNPALLSIQFTATNAESTQAMYWSFDRVVSMTIKRNGRNLKVLPYPVDIFFICKPKPKVKLTQGVIPMTSLSDEVENKNNLVTVYKINYLKIAGSLTVTIKFHNIKDNEDLQVLLLQNNWPDYNTMTTSSKTISSDENVYKIKLENKTEEESYYLGILPRNLDILRVRPIAYTFEVRYFQCLLRHGDEWSSQGCYVGNETTEEMLHCQCHHLSLFGGRVAIPPRELDLLNDIHLVLEIKDNPRTFLLVCSLILVYLIVMVWARHSDRKDELQRHVVVLADNFPGERWPYLVTVFTGFWIGAGTDANVGLRLYGTKGMSKVHMLRSHKRKVLKQNCDDWFLIFTPKSLGGITKIHLFHDHRGRSHDWYCSKILIYDLIREENYKFIIEKWLSLKEVDECVELYAYPTSTVKYLKRARVIKENIIFGLRETHLLLSIFTRHPRSSVTRSQRLSIFLCIVMVHLLTSIMFYHVEESAVNHGYSLQQRQIIISMESSILAAPFTFIVIFCFKKSRIITVPKSGENVPLTLTAKMAIPLESGLQANQSQTRWMTPSSASNLSLTTSTSSLDSGTHEDTDGYGESGASEGGSCWKDFYQQLRNVLYQGILVRPLMPVRIVQEDEGASHIRKTWMWGAWILCLLGIFGGGLFILFYNIKMDFKTSSDWMQQSFRYSLGNILIMSPARIIMFAVILAVLYGQLQYIPSYECDTEAALNIDAVGNEQFLSRILKDRRKNCYRPLNNRETAVIRMRKSNWRRWRIVINFVVVILLYAVLTLEVLFHWEGLYVPTTNHILQMFSGGHNITSFSSFYEYMSTVALPAFNKESWYNGEPTVPHEIWKQETGFTKDFHTRLMSRPFLRQQRVLQDSCTVIPMMTDMFSRCYAPLSWSNMEDEEFSMGWSQSHMPREESDDSPWMFSYSDSPLLICGFKSGKCYLPGGYISKLDYNLTTSVSILRNLNQLRWLDEATRVVFLELVMYNVNTNFMSYVTPMLEKLADGSFQFNVKVTNLHSVPINYAARLIVLLIFTLYYFCRTLLLFNRYGLAYLFSSMGLLDIFLNLLLYVTMISMTFYYNARKAYIYEWLESSQEDLRMTRDIFVHRAILRYEMIILVIIIPAQVLHKFRFGKRNLIVFKTLTNHLKFTLGLGLVLATFYLALMEINTINGVSHEFFTLNCIFGWLSYRSFTKPSFNFFCAIICFVSNVVFILTVVISVKCYKEAKTYLRYDKNFNMIYFLYEKLKHSKMKTSELKRKLGKCLKIRTRAGADGVDFPPTYRTCGQVRQMCADLSFKCDLLLDKLTELEKAL